MWSGLLLPAPWAIFHIVALNWPTHIPPWVRLPNILTAAITWVLLVIVWRPSQAAHCERVLKLASGVLTYLGLSGVVLLAALMHAWWAARHLNAPPPLMQGASAEGPRVGRGRVIWILLDELSYDQTFEHRFPGLQLPAFDALAAQSTVFTRVLPAGIQTDQVVPALLTGRTVDAIRSTPNGKLLLPDPGTGKWSSFDQHATVFQDALNAGYGTAVAGWYNPYCRLLPSVLAHCAWSDSAVLVDGLSSDGELGANMVNLFAALFGNATMGRLAQSLLPVHDLQRAGQITDYHALVSAGDRLLADPASTFVLLHMPFPHPPGFYNRTTGRLTTESRSYLDNLVLADHYIAHVHALLEKKGQWDSSTLLVMGDHSWRTSLIWTHAGNWTAEEATASRGGQYDERPAYLLKLPGQHAAHHIDSSFRAVRTRQLLDRIFTNRMHTTEDLQALCPEVDSRP